MLLMLTSIGGGGVAGAGVVLVLRHAAAEWQGVEQQRQSG